MKGGSLKDLEHLLRLTSENPGGGWAVRIWSRVSRESHSAGRMPLIGPPMSQDDQTVLKRYLDEAIVDFTDEERH